MPDNISEKFPILQKANKKIIGEFEQYAILKKYPAGEMLTFEGDECAYFFIVLSGQIRVYKSSESGREITLYRVNKYESCVLTAFCILSRSRIPAFAVAENDLELVIIPSSVFRDWIDQFEIWREFTFSILSVRLTEILHTIDKMAFQRLDAKVAGFLIRSLKGEGDSIKITHENLAREVGSSREVVSRILAEFAREGLVSPGRGVITVTKRDELSKIAAKMT